MIMSDGLLSGLETLRDRALPEGGFSNTAHGEFRPDATAWAILALSAHGGDQEIIHRSRSRLAAAQLPDGRVPISPAQPEIYWPTPLALLAWLQAPARQGRTSRAAQFLLSHSGETIDPKIKGPAVHDSTIKGWAWVEGTYSWDDPTGLAVIALKSAGQRRHPRVLEGARLLLNRQCLHGGWNYGNVEVYGKELRPMPEHTGLALDALKGLAPRANLEQSLDYLRASLTTLRTPISLGWGLLGLGAWGERPAAAGDWLEECWRRQVWYGAYDTTSLSLLILASRLSGGLSSLFSPSPAPQG
jgi:hypothetical protein